MTIIESVPSRWLANKVRIAPTRCGWLSTERDTQSQIRSRPGPFCLPRRHCSPYFPEISAPAGNGSMVLRIRARRNSEWGRSKWVGPHSFFMRLAGCDILTALIGINRCSAAGRYKSPRSQTSDLPRQMFRMGGSIPPLRAASPSPWSLAGGFPFVGRSPFHGNWDSATHGLPPISPADWARGTRSQSNTPALFRARS